MSFTTESIEPIVVPGDFTSVIGRWSAVSRALSDKSALHSTDQTYTFGEADELSTVVGAEILKVMTERDSESPVGTLAEHNAQTLIGMLAIMKTGRIVVMLDPHLPMERLREIIRQAGITTCLTDRSNSALARELRSSLTTVIRLDDLIHENTANAVRARGNVSANFERPLLEAPFIGSHERGGADPAFIVFTSGSTGRPKGVIQTHDLLLNDAYAHRQHFGITPDDRVAIVLPYGFAAGLSLVFGALLNGAPVWTYDPRDRGVRALIDWIDENSLSTLHCTPHLLRSIIGAMSEDRRLSSLRFVSTVGEAVTGHDVEAVREHVAPSAAFFNWSGSSEVGLLAVHKIPAGDPVPITTIPAGHVIANKEVRIVREDSTDAAAGETGEIVTTSRYLSGGYWHDDAANAARFSRDSEGRIVCRQGDLGRFDENGILTLLGRADSAVKVRGYLVEPSEVEAAFLETGGIAEVVVVPVVEPLAPTRLIAYVVPHPGIRPESSAALRRSLRNRLPEYMVPAVVVQLVELPRNERGKIDRTLLPSFAPDLQTGEPMTQWELVVADIWRDILGLDVIGLDDDFMALGGDSLSAEELLATVQERFNVDLVSSDLIASPTLREFTQRVRRGSVSLPRHPDVVTLQAGGSGTPFFCFAGSGGLALAFLPLSRHFPDRDIYAFQAHGLERRGIPDWSVEASARRYLEIIRIVRPHGPYVLLGHSFGGLVALEIARLLTEVGESVELVGLFDTYLPSSTFPEPYIYKSPGGPQSLLRRARSMAGKQFYGLFPGLPTRDEWARHGRAYLAGVVAYSGRRQFEVMFDQGRLVSQRYEVKPYAGRILAVLADDNPDGPEAWEPMFTGPHTFLEISSEHSAFLREPYVSELAIKLLSELEQESA